MKMSQMSITCSYDKKSVEMSCIFPNSKVMIMPSNPDYISINNKALPKLARTSRGTYFPNNAPKFILRSYWNMAGSIMFMQPDGIELKGVLIQ